jgi:zinc/manganese transport system ATP-binding protein
MAGFSEDAPPRRAATDAVQQPAAMVTQKLDRWIPSLASLSAYGRQAFARRLWNGDTRGADPAAEDRTGQAGIQLENLTVTYDGRPALEGLTLCFAPASLTAVIGPNGAGKSTLLKALAGIVRPQSGEIRGGARHRTRLAYLPQQAELDREFPITVGELVVLGGWREFGAFSHPASSLVERARAAAAAVGLGGVISHPIAELSAGQFQRALFARILMQNAAVILLDEPFAAIDESTTEELLGTVKRWHSEGRTVIAVLHDFDQVRTHFPTAVLLAHSCVASGDTATVLTKDNLARARDAVMRRSQEGGRTRS